MEIKTVKNTIRANVLRPFEPEIWSYPHGLESAVN